MAEMLDDNSSLESTTVGIYRTAKTVKGGRNFSFAALVVVGDRRGRVGIGYAKAPQVPLAIEKAQKVGKRSLRTYPLQDRTIPHVVEGRFLASKVRLVPASPGTGVIAGASVRAVLEMFGIQDCLTKCFGSTNPKNVVKATFLDYNPDQMQAADQRCGRFDCLVCKGEKRVRDARCPNWVAAREAAARATRRRVFWAGAENAAPSPAAQDAAPPPAPDDGSDSDVGAYFELSD